MDEDCCIERYRTLIVVGTTIRDKPRKMWDKMMRKNFLVLDFTEEMTKNREMWASAVCDKMHQAK